MSRSRVHLAVGINSYASSPLRGCVNDALDWTTATKAAGYVPLPPLLDGKATKTAILDALDEQTHRLRRGDRFVFTYSGHGTWVPDRNGDEADGRDEALVPVDYRSAGLILDDELHEVFASFRHGVRVLVVSDSCHSGTVTRSVAADRPVAEVADSRYLPPAQFLEGHDLERAVAAQELPARGLPRAGAVLLSGCTDLEVAYDAHIGGRYRGAFTAAALDALRTKPRNVQAWHRAIRKRLPSTPGFPYPQTPELVASAWQRYGYAAL